MGRPAAWNRNQCLAGAEKEKFLQEIIGYLHSTYIAHGTLSQTAV